MKRTFYPCWSATQAKKGIFINDTIPPNLQVRLSCLWCSIRRQFLFKNVDIQWAASSPQSRAETLNILMKDNEIFTIVFIVPLVNVILSYSTISGFLHVPISTDFGLTQNGLVSHRLILWWWMQLQNQSQHSWKNILITALKHVVIPDQYNTGNHCIHLIVEGTYIIPWEVININHNNNSNNIYTM